MLKHRDRRGDAARRQNRPAAERSPWAARWTTSLACAQLRLRDCAAFLASGLLKAITIPIL